MSIEKREQNVPTSAKVLAGVAGFGVGMAIAKLAERAYVAADPKRFQREEQRKKLEAEGEVETSFERAVYRVGIGMINALDKAEELERRWEVRERLVDIVVSADVHLLDFVDGFGKGSRRFGEAMANFREASDTKKKHWLDAINQAKKIDQPK